MATNARPAELQAALDALHDDYTYRINMVLDEGRDDLAVDLSDEFETEAAVLTKRFAA